MPLVLMEAMSHGLPIISSDLPVCKEIMGDFAIYFKNGDINNLSQSLKDATEIDWERKSKEALSIARRFNITAITNQWRSMIEE
jgi:glycosyltransferase involved in cell wall biosynthesis